MKRIFLLLLSSVFLFSCVDQSSYISDLENRIEELESINKTYEDTQQAFDTETDSPDTSSDDGVSFAPYIPSSPSAPVSPPTPNAPQQVKETDIPNSLLSSYTGTGDSIIKSIKITYPSLLRFQTSDDRHHSIKAYFGNGVYDYDLLVNNTGPYDGSTYLLPDRTYDVVITCNGSWTVDIYSIGLTTDGSFGGTGDYVTKYFPPNSQDYLITNVGTDHFAVKLHYGTGEYDYDLLVNEVGTYGGTLRLPHTDQFCFFEVVAGDGMWFLLPCD